MNFLNLDKEHKLINWESVLTPIINIVNKYYE